MKPVTHYNSPNGIGMGKLHQSKTLEHFNRFSWTQYNHNRYWKPRDCIGLYTYWKICEYFKPKSILEIGFFEGLSFGLFFEASGVDTEYVCVDYNFSNKERYFDFLFKDHPKYNSIKFIETDSQELNLTQNFDLIHIDGNHSYKYVKNDLLKSFPLMHKNSILIMDDVTEHCPDVEKVIDQYLLGQHDFVPFLSADREIFFHHVSHSADDFLDNFISKNTTDIMTFFNYDYKGFVVLRGHIPSFFNDNMSIFIDQLKKFNL
jgi:predicted O-methyltransferase YrrM